MQHVYECREIPSEWRKLNLGCNQHMLKGWINSDIFPYEGVDVVADLEGSWPWDDNSIHYIRAFDIVEHLRNPIHTMNEAYRILAHGGIIEIYVPSTDGRGAFQDPTHVSFWNRNSFLYYSRKQYGQQYPNLIKCDFEQRVHDTPPNSVNVISTWALCRAIKDQQQVQAVSDSWYEKLSNTDRKQRLMPGFSGDSLGTTELTTCQESTSRL